MSSIAQPPVKGLPEGVDLVRIGIAADEDYEIVGGKIFKGPRAGAASGVIVQPAQGYMFHADIRDLSYFPVKIIPPETVKATVTFTYSNSYDQEGVEKALKFLESIPGFVGIERG